MLTDNYRPINELITPVRQHEQTRIMQQREFGSTARLALLVRQCEQLVMTPGCSSFTGQLQEMGPTQGALREHDGQRQSLHLLEAGAGEVDGLEDIYMITIRNSSTDQNII